MNAWTLSALWRDLRWLQRSFDVPVFQMWCDRNRSFAASPLFNRSTLNHCHSGGVGRPAEQIIHAAEKMQASAIVMGKRCHTILHRWMLGSNTQRVLKYAHCPVMIVH